MRRFWIRWYANESMGDCASWPAGTQVWSSGLATGTDDEDLVILVGLVDADSEQEAVERLESCYEEGGFSLDSLEEVELNWVPGRRFPDGKPYSVAP